MKNSAFVLLSLGMIGGCALPNPGPTTSQSYQVVIPGHVMHVTIPPGWLLGYGGVRNKVSFRDLRSDSKTLVSHGILEKSVGQFYSGVRGDFQDWDMTLQIEVLQLPNSMGSAQELADCLATALSEPRVLKSGEKYVRFAGPSVEFAGKKEAVLFASRNGHIGASVELANRSIVSFNPERRAYFLVNERIAIGLRIELWNERRANSESFIRSHDLLLGIASKMIFELLPESEALKRSLITTSHNTSG